MPRGRQLTDEEKAKQDIDSFFKSGEWKKLKQKLSKLKIEPIENPFEALSAKKSRKLLTNTVFDDILGRGGLGAKKLVLVNGEYGTGKTQLAYTLLCEAAQEGTVVYDDSEFSFAPERVVEICKARGLDVEKVMKHLILFQPEDWKEHLAFPATAVPSQVDLDQKELPPISLIIVDSLIAPFDKTKDFMGVQNLALRSQMFRLFFADLRRLARLHDCPVFITNQIISNPEASMLSPNPKYVPMWAKQKGKGGPTVEHIPDIIIYLRKIGTSDVKRLAKLMDSYELPPRERQYIINEKGIDDIPENKDKEENKDNKDSKDDEDEYVENSGELVNEEGTIEE